MQHSQNILWSKRYGKITFKKIAVQLLRIQIMIIAGILYYVSYTKIWERPFSDSWFGHIIGACFFLLAFLNGYHLIVWLSDKYSSDGKTLTLSSTWHKNKILISNVKMVYLCSVTFPYQFHSGKPDIFKKEIGAVFLQTDDLTGLITQMQPRGGWILPEEPFLNTAFFNTVPWAYLYDCVVNKDVLSRFFSGFNGVVIVPNAFLTEMQWLYHIDGNFQILTDYALRKEITKI